MIVYKLSALFKITFECSWMEGFNILFFSFIPEWLLIFVIVIGLIIQLLLINGFNLLPSAPFRNLWF